MSAIVLHVPTNPSATNEDDEPRIPSLDPPSLAAFFYLQLTSSDRFELHSIDDLSSTPHGFTPYLINPSTTANVTNGKPSRTVSTFGSIIASSKIHLDSDLTEEEHAKSVAWKAYIEAKLGDLVSYSYYGNALNYNLFTHPYLVSGLPFFKRYYLPKRIRESYKRRLESEGMWEESVRDHKAREGNIARKLETRDENVNNVRRKIKESFANEKILEKARAAFSLLTRALDASDRKFMFGDSPSSIDLILAAYVLILLSSSIPLPDNQLGQILEKEFHALCEHSRAIERLCTGKGIPRTTNCTCTL